MLRILFLILAFILGRMLFRALLRNGMRRRAEGRRPRSTPPPKSPRSPASAERDPLRDLTQQEISDADFEEIPEEE